MEKRHPHKWTLVCVLTSTREGQAGRSLTNHRSKRAALAEYTRIVNSLGPKQGIFSASIEPPIPKSPNGRQRPRIILDPVEAKF